MINFDSELHQYTDSETGVIIPSVTQILTESGIINNKFYTTEARDRGSAVHELCERYIKGIRYDAEGRFLASLEYVNAFALWCQDKKPYAIKTECRINHAINGKRYCGTFDLLAVIAGKRTLIDIKTGAKAKWHVLQNAAYSMASMDTGDRVNPDQCATLYLCKDGKYKFERYASPEIVQSIERFKEAF